MWRVWAVSREEVTAKMMRWQTYASRWIWVYSQSGPVEMTDVLGDGGDDLVRSLSFAEDRRVSSRVRDRPRLSGRRDYRQRVSLVYPLSGRSSRHGSRSRSNSRGRVRRGRRRRAWSRGKKQRT